MKKLLNYFAMFLVACVFIAVCTGLFFLQTYRWGNCP